MASLRILLLNAGVVSCMEAHLSELENRLLWDARANVPAFLLVLKDKSNTDTVNNVIKAI